jgi:hypothetical protein
MPARRTQIDTKAPEKRIGFAETTDKYDIQKIQSTEVDFCEPTDLIEVDFNRGLSNFKTKRNIVASQVLNSLKTTFPFIIIISLCSTCPRGIPFLMTEFYQIQRSDRILISLMPLVNQIVLHQIQRR